MLHKVFTVYDSKSELYSPPFFLRSTGEAVRSFEQACNDAGHAFGKHSADFTLYEIGTYEDTSAIMVTLHAFTNLGNGLTYKKAVDNLVN